MLCLVLEGNMSAKDLSYPEHLLGTGCRRDEASLSSSSKD